MFLLKKISDEGKKFFNINSKDIFNLLIKNYLSLIFIKKI
jgi:hypothetical protein